MDSHVFWFYAEQGPKSEPHLPVNQPGPPRKHDRPILRRIVHVRKASANFQLRFSPKGR
jgi:hypothetical protein